MDPINRRKGGNRRFLADRRSSRILDPILLERRIRKDRRAGTDRRSDEYGGFTEDQKETIETIISQLEQQLTT